MTRPRMGKDLSGRWSLCLTWVTDADLEGTKAMRRERYDCVKRRISHADRSAATTAENVPCTSKQRTTRGKKVPKTSGGDHWQGTAGMDAPSTSSRAPDTGSRGRPQWNGHMGWMGDTYACNSSV